MAVGDTPVSLRIERADASDADALLALQRLAYRSEAEIYDDFTIPPLRQTRAGMCEDLERQLVLKATLDGRIVGSVRAYERDGTCHIGRLIVDPGCQNRGIGSRLMAAIESSFPAVRRYELFTGHRSERNLHLYRKLGYAVLRSEPSSDRLTVVYLEKPGPGFSPAE